MARCCLHRTGHHGLPPIPNPEQLFEPLIVASRLRRVPWRRAAWLQRQIRALIGNNYHVAVFVWNPRRGRHAHDHPTAFEYITQDHIKAEAIFTARRYGRTHVYICVLSTRLLTVQLSRGSRGSSSRLSTPLVCSAFLVLVAARIYSSPTGLSQLFRVARVARALASSPLLCSARLVFFKKFLKIILKLPLHLS